MYDENGPVWQNWLSEWHARYVILLCFFFLSVFLILTKHFEICHKIFRAVIIVAVVAVAFVVVHLKTQYRQVILLK